MDESVLYQALFDRAFEALVVLEHDGTVVLANRAARELPGVDLPALVGGRAEQGDRLATFRAALDRGERASADVRVVGDDGQIHDLSLEGRREDGYRVVAAREVTELRRLQRELRELRRVESLGYRVASLAHDVNNLLTVIRCSSAALARGAPERPELAEISGEIREATARAAAIVRRLLAGAQRESPPERVNLSEAVAAMRPLLQRLVGGGVELVLLLDGALADASVDRDALERALMNLAANARDAMLGGGRLTVATCNVSLGDAGDAALDRVGDRYVALTVADTGAGMSREVRDRMFDPFFTTKSAAVAGAEGAGTGLGLTTVQRFAAQSGGCIAVHSAPGQGTAVVLYLPALAQVADARSAPTVFDRVS